MADPYQSVRNKITLPTKVNIREHRSIFNKVQRSNEGQKDEISIALIDKTNQLVEQFNHSFEVFSHSTDFKFKFPQSHFPSVPQGQSNMITYEQKMIREEENTFKNKLMDEQLDEIEQKGEFKVKSNISYVTLPYVWKINEKLFWGKERRMQVWFNSLAIIYGWFVEAKNKLTNFVPVHLKRLSKLPQILFSIFFGQKKLQVVVDVNYKKEIFKDFWQKIMGQYYKETQQWGSALWNYLYVYYDPNIIKRIVSDPYNPDYYEKQMAKKHQLEQQRRHQLAKAQFNKSKITKVHNDFNREWTKMKKKVFKEITQEAMNISSSNNINSSVESRTQSEEQMSNMRIESSNSSSKNDEKVLQILSERRFTLYVQHLRNQLPKQNVPVGVINSIVFILRLFRAIDSKYRDLQHKTSLKQREIGESVKRKHKIKSLYQPFFDRAVHAQLSVIKKALQQQLYDTLLKDPVLNKLLTKQQREAYKQYLNLRSNYSTLQIAKTKQIPELHAPSRIFYSNYLLLPPFKVIHQNGYYSLKKVSDNITVDTTQNFWKLRLYWMRLKTWTINCAIFLIYACWLGPTGLRCLYGREPFGYEQQINYTTGQRYYIKRNTVYGTFMKVIEGIKNSRKNFQDTPDLGLLGKNVSRIFNYIECYLFRLFFVGVIIVLIGYPILIIVCSIIAIFLGLTIWAWIPLVLTITYTFNIMIYQFETAFFPNRFTERTAPLFGTIYLLIRLILGTIILSLNLVVWAPIKAFLLFTFCFLQRIFRTLFDKFMLFLFRKVGRTPSRDTSIARKISGPGMSKDFYMSINQEDVYVLMQSKLQRIFIEQLSEMTKQTIIENSQKADRIVRKLLGTFGVSFGNLDYINQNSSQLTSTFYTQYSYYMARYPRDPYRVRFTQQQIDNYFENTVSIVRNFVTKHQIQGWIFERYHLYQDMYDQLTRSIWGQIFGCGDEIFEPLEKLDARFKLQDQYADQDGFNYSMKKNVNEVLRSLEGEVKLQHHKSRVSPFKHSLINQERQTGGVQDLLTLYYANSDLRVNLDLSSVKTLFVPCLNLPETIIVDRQQRQRRILQNPEIIDVPRP